MQKYLLFFLIMTALIRAETIEMISIPSITVEGSTKEDEPHLVIQETTPGMKQPVINGLMGDKILITLDNNKFSNSLFRAGPNQYYGWVPDQFVVKNTINETLQNSSLGGTVNRVLGINTTGLDIDVSINTFTGAVTYSDEKFQIGVLDIENDNLVTPKNGEVEHSSYNQKAFFLGINTKSTKTKFMTTQSNNIDRTDKFEKGDYYVYDLQKFIMLSHEYKILDTNIVIMPSWQQFREKIDRASPEKKDVDSTNNVFGLNISNKRENIFTNADIFKYGLSNHYENISYKKGLDTRDYHYNTFSLWASYNDIVAEQWDYTFIYNFAYLDVFGEDIKRRIRGNSFGLNTNYYIDDDFYGYGSIHSNFKFPTITNLSEARSDSVEEIPNSSLGSEKAFTGRIGIFYKGLDFSVFHKKLDNMIIRIQTDIPDGISGFKWRYDNTDEGFIKGVSLTYTKTFEEDWKINFNAELLVGKTDYDYISKLQPIVTNTYVQYKDIWVEFLYAPSVSEKRMALKDKTDIRIKDHNYGYSILNLGYTHLYNQHKLRFSLDNVFNNKGRVYGNSVDFNERRINVGYSYHL